MCFWAVIAPLTPFALTQLHLPGMGDVGCLAGYRYALAKLIAAVGYSTCAGLVCLFLVILLRLVFRRQWIALAATCTVFVASLTPMRPFGVEGIVTTIALTAAMAALLLVIMRIGLLAFIVTNLLAVVFLYEFPLTTHLSAWYGQPTVLLLLVTGILTCYGFFVSLGGRPMFGEKLLEE